MAITQKFTSKLGIISYNISPGRTFTIALNGTPLIHESPDLETVTIELKWLLWKIDRDEKLTDTVLGLSANSYCGMLANI